MVLKSLFNFPFIFLLPSFPNCSGCTTQQQNSAFSNWDTVRETCQFGLCFWCPAGSAAPASTTRWRERKVWLVFAWWPSSAGPAWAAGDFSLPCRLCVELTEPGECGTEQEWEVYRSLGLQRVAFLYEWICTDSVCESPLNLLKYKKWLLGISMVFPTSHP